MQEVEVVEALPLVVSNSAAVERSQLEATVEIARRYPRSITKFKQEATSMVSYSPEIAQEMGYALTKGGKTIKGPSIRLAEIVATAWGNLRCKAQVTEVGETMLTATGWCFDCEKNVAVEVSVQRRITYKSGERFSDDMITITGNAACSIAMRNAILKVVPRAYVDDIYDAAMKVAFGDAKSLSTTRQTAFEVISKLGVPVDRILAVVKRPGIEDVTLEDVIVLRGLFQAVRDGDQTVEEAFPPIATEKPSDGTTEPKAGTKSRVAAKLKPQTHEEPDYNTAAERSDD